MSRDAWQVGLSVLAIVLASASLIWQAIRHVRDKQARKLAQEERLARQELARITPSHVQLQEMAVRHPPPQQWYDEDMEGLF
jgi:hypothetical protein